MSNEQLIPSSETSIIVLQQIGGDLSVEGWGEANLSILSDSKEEIINEPDGQTVRIRCDGDCRLRIPVQATLTIGALNGDGQIRNVRGALTIDRVNGDLRIQNVGPVTIQAVEGDLSTKNVGGEFTAQRVSGDVSATNIAGTITLAEVMGDASLAAIQNDARLATVKGDVMVRGVGAVTVGDIRGDLSINQARGDVNVQVVAGDADIRRIGGGCYIADVRGDLSLAAIDGDIQAQASDDISLRLIPYPERSYQIVAGDDLTCRLPVGAQARLEITYGGELRGRKIDLPEQTGDKAAILTLGEGGPTVHLKAGRNMTLIGSESGWEENEMYGPDVAVEFSLRAGEFARRIVGQVEAQLDAVSRQIDEKLADLGNGGDEIEIRVQDKVQHAMSQVEKKISDAMRQAERRAERESRRSRTWSASPPPAKPKRPPVSDEERMLILRMVEEGKISVEQAEQLLAALK
jgi:hypothetical protein